MASRFSAQMSGQMAGEPAATRVMSRKPPAARRRRAACSSAPSAARAMSVAAVRWGTWDTIATSSSWRSGGRATTSAPRDVTTDRMRAKALGSVSTVGVSTHVAPSKRLASAPSTPSCSEPAMGWPPTNRASATAAATGPLTLPTSVTRPDPAARAARASPGMASTGTQMNVRSASGSWPTASRAPRTRARSARSESASRPVTCHPRARSANPIDPPISPVPTTTARSVTPAGRRSDRPPPPGTRDAARPGSARWRGA